MHSCGCSVRFSYATVDSYIGKLRAIFKDAGREGDWNTALSLGNPAASAEVKAYLKAFASEQLQAAVTPKQATPLFLVKIVPLSRLIQGKMLLPGITASQLFVYVRDAAFFKALFFSGDRANDLTLVKTQEIMRFPQNDGLQFNHVWGKSLRDGSANLFGIKSHSDSSLCPVKAIELYIAISSALSLDLLSGFLFRPLNSLGKIQNKQLANSTLQSRLRSYLQEANIYNGETLHSFRAGLAITLALSGSQLADIMEHVYRRHAPTASHYLKVAQVLRPGGPSDLLSRHDPSAQALADSYVKIVPLSRLIQGKMLLPGITASQLFVYVRDAAFFKALFFSGDRANDLTLVKTQEIMRFPQNDGLQFNHVWGKSLRDGSANLFGIKSHSDSSLCPVKAIELYIAISSALSLDLLSGFLFRPLNSLGKIQNKQLANSTLQSRLRSYLQEANIYNGETLHSFRAGLAITLALSGSQLADIMEHVYRRHAPTASHYLKVAQVLRPGGPSDLLSRHDPSAQALADSYTDLNSLLLFTDAFSTGISP